MTVQQPGGRSSDLRYFIDTLHNRLRMYYDAASQQLDDSTHISYDSLGNRKVQQPYLNGSPYSLGGAEWRQYWYDALGRTTGTTEWECTGVVDPDPGDGSEGSPPPCVWNQISDRRMACGYDPFSRVFDSCQGNEPFLGYDGDNVVRTAADGAYDWSFVHGPGTDDPILGYYRGPGDSLYLYFLTDGQGRQFAAADTTGQDRTSDNRYLWYGGRLVGGTRFGESYSATRQSNPQMYQLSNFRNRFYDQVTGRWTQEDPSGAAGGSNLYQFNGNNPVAYTDPFGLCVPPLTPICLVAYGIAIGATVFGGTRIAYNAATDRPLAEGVQGDVAQGSLVGANTGVVAGAGLIGAGTREAVREGAQALARPGSVQTGLLREFLGKGLQGAEQRAANFSLPQGLTRESLQWYAQQAQRAIGSGIDKSGVQAARLNLVEKALEAFHQ